MNCLELLLLGFLLEVLAGVVASSDDLLLRDRARVGMLAPSIAPTLAPSIALWGTLGVEPLAPTLTPWGILASSHGLSSTSPKCSGIVTQYRPRHVLTTIARLIPQPARGRRSMSRAIK